MYKNKQQQVLILTICLLIAGPTVSYFINTSIDLIIPSKFIWDTVILSGVTILLSIISFVIVCRKLKKDFLLLFLVFILLFLFSYLVFPENRKFMYTSLNDFTFNNFYRLFLYAMPVYFYLRLVTDYYLLYKYFYTAAIIATISGISTYLLYIVVGRFELQYMVFSYNLLFPTMYCFYDYFQKRRKISLVLGIISAVIIFIGGARGPLVCLGAYLLLYGLFNLKNNKLTIFFITGLASIGTIYIRENFTEIVLRIQEFLFKFEINSRTLDLILKEDYLDNSGRDTITDVLLEELKETPLIGSGMFGDRAITERKWITGEGTYAHNFVIEVLSQYGVILGLIFLSTFVLLIFRALLIKQNLMYVNLVLLFIPIGFVKLMLSGSYLNEMYFFLLLAAIINAIESNRRHVKL